MQKDEFLAQQFEADRERLRAVAYRMLGSAGEAEDAVQEAWLRLHRSDAAEIDNLRGWLTTVVARVSLDMLRSRKSRREEPLSDINGWNETVDPQDAAILADSVSAAVLVLLESLGPAERVAFVLHDMFEIPFEEIAPIVGKSPAATRQLASRARRRVKGSPATEVEAHAHQRKVIEAFRMASRNGDLAALLRVLAPDIVLRADPTAVSFGAQPETRGADAVANTFSGRAQAARPALVGGMPGMAWVVGGQPKVAFRFAIEGDVIVGIELLAAPDTLAGLNVQIEEEQPSFTPGTSSRSR